MVEEVKKEEVKAENPEFSLETLFMKGRVTRTYLITKNFSVKFRSLTGEETMQARSDSDASSSGGVYGISILTLNLVGLSIDELNKESFIGEVKPRREKLLKLPAPVMDKVIEMHSKFFEEVQNLFPKDPGELVEAIEKK